jgi:16S rRNA (uracil1498-N3)-methyltransferase
MSRRRFYAPVTDFAKDHRTVTLSADEARHLREVLRLKPGDEVYVFDGVGREVACAVREVRRDQTLLEILREVEPARAESPFKLTLGLALLKGDKFDLVVQKTTELGVFAIVPVATKLSDIKLRNDTDAEKRVMRWQRIALEAAKQSGRAVVPRVLNPEGFDEFLQRDDEQRIVFSERGGQPVTAVTRERSAHVSAATVLVGPEGGLSDAEVSGAQESGWALITLGGRVLRAETAAITITALLQHMYGDLR